MRRLASRRASPLAKWVFAFCALVALCAPGTASAATPPKVYVLLWFDTEDYILPASDDAAKQVAEFLTREGIRATFKVVGEKARTLERRKRFDVIEALKKHEIGYHSNYHSVHPTPAAYLDPLGWDDGVAEFERREGTGRDDVARVFGTPPTTYGQPGRSWAPQAFGAMKAWGMDVYLDAGSHVDVEGRPHFYCGLLTLYKLTHTLRADLNDAKKLDAANDRFAEARKALLAEGGGVVSTVYHPCEFVHKKFWDGVNFAQGANPPREKWQLPPQKTAEETRSSFAVFESYVQFMKRFPEVQFITASEAVKLYRDRTREKSFLPSDIQSIAAAVGDAVNFQRQGASTLSPAEVLALLCEDVCARENGRDPGPPRIEVKASPLGPTGAAPAQAAAVTTDWSQFRRTTLDVHDQLKRRGRVPSSVWLGSVAVPPEAYLAALARACLELHAGRTPERIEVKPAKLVTVKHIAADDQRDLWRWVIFPPGFRAPRLMEVARQQAWTIKPAVLGAR